MQAIKFSRGDIDVCKNETFGAGKLFWVGIFVCSAEQKLDKFTSTTTGIYHEYIMTLPTTISKI